MIEYEVNEVSPFDPTDQLLDAFFMVELIDLVYPKRTLKISRVEMIWVLVI